MNLKGADVKLQFLKGLCPVQLRPSGWPTFGWLGVRQCLGGAVPDTHLAEHHTACWVSYSEQQSANRFP